MKILYCERELGPMSKDMPVTLLADSSMSRNHRPLFLPPHRDRWVMTFAPAVRVSRLGKFVAPRFARRYYDAMAIVARLRPADPVRLPASAIDTAFDSSVVVGDWLDIQADSGPRLSLSLDCKVCCDITLDLDVVDDTLAWLSSYFMIKHGDVIVPGDIPGNFQVGIDDMIKVTVNNLDCLDFKIK